MPNVGITSFSGGEISPHIDARSDTEKYASSCRELTNMLPLVYGDVVCRPGTEYIAKARNSPGSIRLIPFIYSSEIAYVCAFSEKYVQYYYDGALIHSQLAPYHVEDLPSLQYRQIGDVMWLVHPKYAPRKLTRTGPTDFTNLPIVFTKGPFLDRNDIAEDNGVTLTSNKTTPGTGTLSASAATFVDGHVGSLWQLIHARANTVVSRTIAAATEGTPIDVKGTFSFTTHGTWTATVVLRRSEDAAHVIWDAYRTYIGVNDKNISLATTETEDGVQYRIDVTAYTSNTGATADLSVDMGVQTGIVRIDSINTPKSAGITVLTALASMSATKRWAEGAWSAYRGYPAAIAFCEDRVAYGGTNHNPQTIWFSKTGDYENFEAGVLDADSFSLVLTTMNDIRWMESLLDALVVGTSGDEWAIASNKLGQPITPTNFTAKQQKTYGSSPLQAVRVLASALFVDFVGRKIREMAYNVQEGQYAAPDLTILAEHITKSGITSIAMQMNPDQILWCTLNDGTLISLTYERDQNVVAWARHLIGGLVESGPSTPTTIIYKLTPCSPSGSPYYTDSNLALYVDRVIEISENPGICYTVSVDTEGASSSGSATIVSDWATCDACFGGLAQGAPCIVCIGAQNTAKIVMSGAGPGNCCTDGSGSYTWYSYSEVAGGCRHLFRGPITNCAGYGDIYWVWSLTHTVATGLWTSGLGGHRGSYTGGEVPFQYQHAAAKLYCIDATGKIAGTASLDGLAPDGWPDCTSSEAVVTL